MNITVQEYQKVVDAEWSILYDKLEAIVKSGAKVVLSKLPIGDVATQYFADRYVLYIETALLNIELATKYRIGRRSARQPECPSNTGC